MNKKETAHVLAIMQTNYPDTFRGKSEDVLQGLVDLWQTCFAEEPVELVMEAVKAHMITSTDRYMPQIGVIKEAIHKLITPPQMSEAEAWALISRALSNSSYGSVKEFEKLPPVLQRVVGSPAQLMEWARSDVEKVQTVIASNVQRSFRAISQSEAELSKLPAGMRERMAQLSGGVFKPLGDGGTETRSLMPDGGAGG